jgi:hypothetical protein
MRLSAEAALIPSVPQAAAAARTALIRHASRRWVLPVIVIVLPVPAGAGAQANEWISLRAGPAVRALLPGRHAVPG